MGTRVMLSASSDIGAALCRSWVSRDIQVIGTYRNRNSKSVLRDIGVDPVHCDLSSRRGVTRASKRIARKLDRELWDVLVLAAGTQEPVGKFSENLFRDWERSILVNFVRQVQVLHELLPYAQSGARVLFFAGGGTNGAVERYSAYTISKIASIKLCELLSAEEPEIGFTSIGPGWVKTKIHSQTLAAGSRAGENLQVAEKRLASDDFFPMGALIERIEWLLAADQVAVSGRNFSAVHDWFDDPGFEQWLIEDQNRYKLRRNGNDLKPSGA